MIDGSQIHGTYRINSWIVSNGDVLHVIYGGKDVAKPSSLRKYYIQILINHDKVMFTAFNFLLQHWVSIKSYGNIVI